MAFPKFLSLEDIRTVYLFTNSIYPFTQAYQVGGQLSPHFLFSISISCKCQILRAFLPHYVYNKLHISLSDPDYNCILFTIFQSMHVDYVQRSWYYQIPTVEPYIRCLFSNGEFIQNREQGGLYYIVIHHLFLFLLRKPPVS